MFDCLAHSKSTGNTSYYNHLLPLLEIIMAFKSAEWILQLRDLGLPNPIVDSGHHFLASSSGRFHITSNEKYIFWHHSWKSEKLGCSKRPVLATSFTPSRNRISESYHWRTLNTHVPEYMFSWEKKTWGDRRKRKRSWSSLGLPST